MRLNAHRPTFVVAITLLGSLAVHAQVAPGSTAKPEQNAATIPAQKPDPKPSEVLQNLKDGLKYVWIPSGTFTMGCSPGDNECYAPEKPPHQVTLSKGFWIGQTEVTVGAYQRFTAATGRQIPPAPEFNADWANQNMSIVNVTWDESLAYCQWSGGRLPTEAEWEYAARAGNAESRYAPLDEIAWYADNSGRQRLDSDKIATGDSPNYFKRISENGNGTHEVGQKQANGLGLHDTLGNAFEWVSDWFDQNYYQSSPSSDPAGPGSGKARVLRGGSWRYMPGFVRVSYRSKIVPNTRRSDLGLRCVADKIVIP